MTGRLPLLLFPLLLGAGCSEDAPTPPPPATPTCRIVSINSDYASTSVSVLHEDGTVCADNVINSGTAAPGLVTALSGDVVAPSTPDPAGRLVLIDRFPNAVITFVDPKTWSVLGQLAVAENTPSNPHDVAFVSATKAYVSRAAANDLLIIDPTALTITGRIDLAAEATSGELRARPDRFARVGGRVWVNLRNLTPEFDKGGPGRVLAIDEASDEIVARVPLDGLQNCSELAATASGKGLWVVCTGVFVDPQQMDHSGIAFVDLEDDQAPEEGWRRTASELVSRPIGFFIQPIDEDRLVFVSVGNLTGDGEPDRLHLLSRTTGVVIPLASAGPFELGSVLMNPQSSLIYAVGNPQHPRVHRLSLTGEDLGNVDPNPAVGLPPRTLAWFR